MITGNQQRIWIGILNRSLADNIVIKKNKPFGFFMLESKEDVNIKHETAKTTQKRTRRKYQKRTQSGSFLNRYDFTYAGRDTANQVGKITPGIIKNASSEINNIAQQRINQIINQGGEEVERMLPNILKGAIEDVYQTPFCLLGNFGRQQPQKLKNKILS